MSKSKSNLYIHSAKIIDPNSKWHEKKVSLIIENGVITKIGSSLTKPKKCTEIKEKNLHISPGWLDLLASLGEPGYEDRENFATGLKAAAAGGFTGIIPGSDTMPAVDHRSGIEYILNKTKDNAVDVFPCGAISKGLKGNEMAEMADMRAGGAVCFADHKRSIMDARLMIKSLLYVKSFDGLIMHFPADQNIYNNGQVNEGVMSTRLGLKPMPAIAEEIMVNRDLRLAEYTDQRIHFSLISSPDAVSQIKTAQKKGIKASAAVSSYHILLDEENLEHFGTNFKVMPPLKPKSDINALIKGLKDGTISAIVSDHSPLNIELKDCEFDQADFGIVNLETSFAAANTALKKHLSVTDIISKFCHNPRSILGMEAPKVEEGIEANLTFFDPDLKWTPDAKGMESTSSNTPFSGSELIGKPLGIYNNDTFIWNE